MTWLSWLLPAALIGAVASGIAAEPVLLSEIETRGLAPRVGGLSALETADGNRFLLMADRGRLFDAEIQRDERNQVMTGLSVRMWLMRNSRGQPFTGKQADSEGLAMAADGQLFASFEVRNLVARLDRASGKLAPLPSPPVEDVPPNRTLEALAVADDGALYLLSEYSNAHDIPILRLRSSTWEIAGHLPRSKGFLPVGADFGPDGLLYVLERRLTLFGFSSRVRSWDPRSATSRIVLATPGGRHGNLEGIAVWTDAGGNIRLTMVADDNFNAWQSGAIVEYRLDARAPGA